LDRRNAKFDARKSVAGAPEVATAWAPLQTAMMMMKNGRMHDAMMHGGMHSGCVGAFNHLLLWLMTAALLAL
jgi:hypothetical protein